jgi:hypothetical protein
MGLPLERPQDAAPCVEEKSAFNHLCQPTALRA